MSGYVFQMPWGGGADSWQQAIDRFNPGARKFLEVGSFEGRSSTFLLDSIFRPGEDYELFCVDTWQGGEEHGSEGMPIIESNFDHNVGIALQGDERSRFKVVKLKGLSSIVMAGLVTSGHVGSFEFIFIDGSHQCPDVLTDLTLAFLLCGVGGIIVCDDYTWFPDHRRGRLLHSPKLAIDSFANCFWDKLAFTDIGKPGQPIFVKVAE